jgi:ankyrin repeat protein
VFLSSSRATDADGVYQEFMAALFQKRGRHATALHEAANRGDVPAALAAAAQQAALHGGVDAVLAAMEGGEGGEGSGDEGVVAALEAEAAGGRGAKRTPLHIAAMKGRAPTVEALLRAAHDAGGDDALAKQLLCGDATGMTPLMLAAKAGSAATCKALLDVGGDELKVEQLRAVGAGQTPLMHAAAARSAAACEALLPAAVAAGVLDQATDRGRTACVPACGSKWFALTVSDVLRCHATPCRMPGCTARQPLAAWMPSACCCAPTRTR